MERGATPGMPSSSATGSSSPVGSPPRFRSEAHECPQPKPGADKPMKRNPDGTWRNARHAIVVSNRIIVARWVTAEILRCKLTGLSMAAIAVHIGRVGQAHEQPLSPFPEGIKFPTNYRISESAVFKACHKAMDRQPAINAEVFRKEDTARCEDRSEEHTSEL